MNHSSARRHKRRAARRAQTAKLTLTSLIDIFTLLVCFLLVGFQGDVQIPSIEGLSLPISSSYDTPELALTLVVTPQDVPAIQAALLRLMGDAALRERLSAAALADPAKGLRNATRIDLPLGHIGMVVSGAENHGFFCAEWVKFIRELFADHAIEVAVDHLFVKLADIKAQFIIQVAGFNFPRQGVDDFDLFTFDEFYAFLTQQCAITDWWFMVDQPVVSHCFTIGIGINRFTEDLTGVFGGCCR